LPRLAHGQAERGTQFVAIIEPDVSDEYQPAIRGLQWLAIVIVFRQRFEELPTQGQRAIGPCAAVMRPIDLLRRQHARTVGC